MTRIETLSDIFRLRAWSMALVGPVQIWYFSIFYLSIVTGFKFSIYSVLILLVSLILYEANIVLLNDIFDRDVDIAAGKSGRVRGHNLGVSVMVTLVLLTGGVSWALMLLAKGTCLLYTAWLLAYVTGVLYSTPPFRLKNRGFLSLICNSVLERPFPVLIAFLFYQYYGVELVLFPILSELVWSVFKHQVHDVETDTVAKVKTYAVMLGRDLSYRIVKYVINPLGVISILAFAAISAVVLRGYSLVFMTSIVLIVMGAVVAIILERKSLVYTDPLDPPYSMFVNLAFLLTVLLPMGVIVLVNSPLYFPLLALFILPLVHYLRAYRPLISRGMSLFLSLPARSFRKKYKSVCRVEGRRSLDYSKSLKEFIALHLSSSRK